jgi:capsular polysaccharide biosynthesis protein
MNLEPSQGMTRYSVRAILEMIFRRWFWCAVCAFIFAIGISAVYWGRSFSTVELSATFIPAAPPSAAVAAESVSGSYSVLMSQSYIGHEEVLDAVAKSVSFAVSVEDLQQAISSKVSETGMSATVTVEWHDGDQAAELLSAVKANLSYAVARSAQAGVIKWLESDPSIAAAPSVSRSRAAIVFVIAGLFGLLVGAGVAFLIGCFDKRVYDPMSVTYAGGDVRVIGMVGLRESKEEDKHPQQIAAIAMYLKKLAETNGHKLMMCLSPGPQCGTSTVVRDVALVLAGMQVKVLIVTVTDKAGFLPSTAAVTPLAPGVDTCALPWDDKETNPDYDGPLSSALAMGLKNYALVLVDCPPLLSHVRLSGLVAGMDTTLLVCGAGVTTHEEAGAAVSLLSRASDRPIYCVWNFVDRRHGYAYLPVEAETEPVRKVTDEYKNIGADVRL